MLSSRESSACNCDVQQSAIHTVKRFVQRMPAMLEQTTDPLQACKVCCSVHDEYAKIRRHRQLVLSQIRNHSYVLIQLIQCWIHCTTAESWGNLLFIQLWSKEDKALQWRLDSFDWSVSSLTLLQSIVYRIRCKRTSPFLDYFCLFFTFLLSLSIAVFLLANHFSKVGALGRKTEIFFERPSHFFPCSPTFGRLPKKWRRHMITCCSYCYLGFQCLSLNLNESWLSMNHD